MTETRAARIADELRHAVNGDAWHGHGLLEIVEGMTAEQAMQRPVPTAHSIWELVLHITTWSNIALRRIQGGEPQPRDGEDWPDPGEFSAARWIAAVNGLSKSHERLCAAVAALSDEDLDRNAPDSKQSIAFMLHGVAQHDAYHGGQISLLKKQVNTHHRRTAI